MLAVGLMGCPSLPAQASYFANTIHTFQNSEGTSPGALVRNPDGSFTGAATRNALGYGSLFRVTANGAFTVLHNFTAQEGSAPFRLTSAPDGTVYGIAYSGGAGTCASGCGAIFKLTPSGAFSVLYTFTGGNDGANPNSFFLGADGNLYGTAYKGGAKLNGTVFRFSPGSLAFSVLHTFCQQAGCGDGYYPLSLVAGIDGNLYGTTTSKLFLLTPAGAYSIVRSFLYDNGSNPSNLLQAPDGSFFFTFAYDPYGSGRVAQLTPLGELKILKQFNYTDGGSPFSLRWGIDGSMYGTGLTGGDAGSYGIAFRVTTAGAVTTLFSFSNTFEGGLPVTILQDNDTTLYGAASAGGVAAGRSCVSCGAIFQIAPLNPASPAVSSFSPAAGPSGTNVLVHGSNFLGATGVTINDVPVPFSVNTPIQINATVSPAASTGRVRVISGAGSGASPTPFQVGPQVFQTLYRFCPGGAYPGCPDGIAPNSLFQGRDGNFYGTSDWSGVVATFFRITPGGQLTTITNGLNYPNAFVEGPDGNFYGTNRSGGYYLPSPCNNTWPEPPQGCGSVVRITPGGNTSLLYNFKGYADGAFPWSNMVVGPGGALYGTASGLGRNGEGVVFRITTSGSFLPVFSFSGTDGSVPNYLATNGLVIYGTTSSGGPGGKGVVYRLNLEGTISVLKSFSGPDGDTPNSLAVGPLGVLFGATQKGGPGGGGVVFRINPNGQFTQLYAFGGAHGSGPSALTFGNDGLLYGVLSSGGAFLGGSVFKLTTQGALTALYSFFNLYKTSVDGYTPRTLVRTSDGSLWGTTEDGGDASCYYGSGCGTFFRIQ
jgi:uncharacterized repeat protein (TIGR03803 family)